TENSSAKALDIARPPAPPVSTSVPSMSKRRTMGMTQGRKAIVRRDSSRRDAYDSSGGFAANVPCARPLGRRFFLEADALAFAQLIEATLDGTPMKEPL